MLISSIVSWWGGFSHIWSRRRRFDSVDSDFRSGDAVLLTLVDDGLRICDSRAERTPRLGSAEMVQSCACGFMICRLVFFQRRGPKSGSYKRHSV